MVEFISAVAVMGVIGGVCGFALGIASEKFAVPFDSRIEDVTNLLPGYNCGACGHPGCEAFATALVEGEEVLISKCRPSKPEQRENILAYFKEYAQEHGTDVTVKI